MVVLVVLLASLGAALSTGASAKKHKPRTRRPTTPPPTSPAETGTPTTAPTFVRGAFNQCAKHSDCVVVPKPGCCPMCRKAAANRNFTAQFADEHKCEAPFPPCAKICFADDRIPVCRDGTCSLVEPWGAACVEGAAPDSPQACPTTAYVCRGSKCVWAPPCTPEEDDEGADVASPRFRKDKNKGRKTPQPTAHPSPPSSCPALLSCDATLKRCVWPANASSSSGSGSGDVVDYLKPCWGASPTPIRCGDEVSRCVDDPRDSCQGWLGEPNCPGLCFLADPCDAMKCPPSTTCKLCDPPVIQPGHPKWAICLPPSSPCPPWIG